MKFIDVLFCDDIRQELHNKLSLIGLYNDRLVLNVNQQVEKIIWPQPINLCALLRFSIDDRKKQADRFEFEYFLNKESMMKINGDLNISTNDNSQFFQLIINGSGIPIKPGSFGFSIKLYASNNLLLHEKREKVISISVN
jgi:hypothetical protein